MQCRARTIYHYTRGPARDCLRRSSFALGVRGVSRPSSDELPRSGRGARYHSGRHGATVAVDASPDSLQLASDPLRRGVHQTWSRPVPPLRAAQWRASTLWVRATAAASRDSPHAARRVGTQAHVEPPTHRARGALACPLERVHTHLRDGSARPFSQERAAEPCACMSDQRPPDPYRWIWWSRAGHEFEPSCQGPRRGR